jgi:hypothetical protein
MIRRRTTPPWWVVAGLILLAAGYALGTLDIDPLSAILATFGLAVAFIAAIVWLVGMVAHRRERA